MVRNKIVLAAVGTIATAGLLFSFTGGDDDIKMKRYQVWHQKDGQKVEFDTLIPMDSEFTVKDFLATRGIDEDNVRIIDLSKHHPHGRRGHGHPGQHKDVEIKVEMDENGNKTITKIEDGVEQIMTEAEFKAWESKHPKPMHRAIRKERKLNGEEGMEFMLSEDKESVEIKMLVDEDGNVQTKKWVNGEEVEMTDDEIKAFENDNGGKKVIFIESDEFTFDGEDGSPGLEDVDINVTIDENGNKTITKTVNGETTTITEEELEKMDQQRGGVRIIEIEGDNTWVPEGETDGKDEVVEIRVIKDKDGNLKKTKTVNGEEVPFTDEELRRIEHHAAKKGKVIRHEKRHGHAEGGDHKRHMEVREHIEHRVVSTDTDEDYTIVLVESGLNQAGEKPQRSRTSDDLVIYPNPNEGVFTVSFSQDESTNASVEILDMNGKSLFQEELRNFTGSYSKEVDLSKYGAGTYIVNLRRGENLTSNKIVVE